MWDRQAMLVRMGENGLCAVSIDLPGFSDVSDCGTSAFGNSSSRAKGLLRGWPAALATISPLDFQEAKSTSRRCRVQARRADVLYAQ